MAEGTKIGDVYFQIGADLAQFNKALKTAESQSETFGQTLRRSFGDLGAIVGDVFKRKINIGEGFSALKAQAGLLGSSLKSALGSGLQSVFNGSVNVIKKGLSGLASVAKEIGRGFLLGIGAFGLTTLVQKMVTAIPDLINQGKEFGQIVANVTQITGAAGERASEFVGVLMLMDAPMQNIVQLMAQFQRNIQTPAVQKAFAELGISIRDSNGNVKDSITLFYDLRAAIEKVGIGSQTMGNAQRAMGRGGIKVFDDMIRMSTKDMDSLIAKVHALGLVMSSEQAQLAENMNWTMRQWDLTLSGIGVGLFQALGPLINTTLSALSDWVSSHRQEIVDFFANISASLIGFVAGLFNLNLALQSFADSLDSTVRSQSPALATLKSRENDVITLEAQLTAEKKAGAGASKDATRAIDAQSKALDRQAKELQELDAVQEKVYRRALAGINAQLDAQLALMDAEDERRNLADRDKQLMEALRKANEDLNQSQIDLLAAQRGEGGKVDADAVAKQMQTVVDAQRAVAEAQTAIADESLDRIAQKRRDEIAAVKEYIIGLDKIVSDALTKADAMRSLTGQERTLADQLKAAKAGGDTVKAGDIQAQLDAVRATAKRLNQQIANEKKQDTIGALKEQLAQERSLVSSTTQSITAQRLAAAKKLRDQAATNYQAEVAEQKHLAELWKNQSKLSIDYGDTIAGDGGKDDTSLAGKFRKVAEESAKWAKSFKDAISGIVDGLANMASSLLTISGDLGSFFKPITDAYNALPDPIKWMMGISVAKMFDEFQNAMLDMQRKWAKMFGIPPPVDTRPLVRGVPAPTPSPSPTPRPTANAAGGIVGAAGRELSWLGEKGSEFVLNNRVLGALNRLNVAPEMALARVASGSGTAQPAIIRLEIGGRQLLDYMDEHLEYRRRI
jgi:hypothetical protein